MKNITTDELRQMTNTEGLILQGCGGDPQEWLNGVNELLTQEGILLEGAVFKDAYVFEHEGLTNLLFSMEEVKLDVGKLVMWRIASHDTFGGTWLSDYLHNRLGVDLDAPPPASEQEPQTQEKTAVLQAYIENAAGNAIGGFTIPLPITAEKLRPWLEAIEADDSGGNVVVWDIRSDFPGLQETLSGMNEGMNLEELNYLAVKISALSAADRELSSASLDSGRHCGSMAELISLTDNLDRFNLQPAFTPEQYGEFLVDMVKDDTAAALSKLEKSEDDDARTLAKHILRLEAHVDYAAYGRTAAEEENGVFTRHGYLTEDEGFQEIYRSPEDIPKEYRLFSPAPLFFKAENIDLTAFVAKAHALCGDLLSDISHSLQVMEARRSAEYLMLISDRHIVLTEAAHPYRYESEQFHDFTVSSEFIHAKAFALHVTDVHQPHVMGHVVEVDVQALREDILQHCIYPDRIDAVLKNGAKKSFALKEWDRLEGIERDQIQSWTRRFEPDAHGTVFRHLDDVRDIHEQTGKAVSENTLLSSMNAAYMARSEHPQPDMLRVSLAAARDIFSHGDTEVFRLLPEEPKLLSPLDAMPSRGGLWYQQYREFAIKKEDISALDRWAGRAIEAAVKPAPERSERKKSHEPEV